MQYIIRIIALLVIPLYATVKQLFKLSNISSELISLLIEPERKYRTTKLD